MFTSNERLISRLLAKRREIAENQQNKDEITILENQRLLVERLAEVRKQIAAELGIPEDIPRPEQPINYAFEETGGMTVVTQEQISHEQLDNSSFGGLIRKFRQQLGFTLRRLSETTGWTHGSIGTLESSQNRRVHGETIETLIRGFGLEKGDARGEWLRRSAERQRKKIKKNE